MIPCSSKSRYLYAFVVAQEGMHILPFNKSSLAPQCNRKIGQGCGEGNCKPLPPNTPSWSFLLPASSQAMSIPHSLCIYHIFMHIMLVSMKTAGVKKQSTCSVAPVQSSDVLQRFKLSCTYSIFLKID